MAQLVKNIFRDAKTKLYVIPPFGLENGQWRAEHHRITEDAKWYNQHGQIVGMGDLAPYDFVNVANSILPEELFVIVSATGITNIPFCDRDELGIEFLAQVADYVVGQGCIWQNKEQYVAGEATTIEGYGEIELISPAEILGMLKTARIVNC